MIRSALTLLLFIVGLAPAQMSGPPGMQEKGPSGYPLGGIDAMGEVDDPKKGVEIRVSHVFPDGFAAKGGLEVGDVIVGAGKRKKFKKEGEEIIAELARAIEAAEAKKPGSGKEHHTLTLRILRGGMKNKIDVPVRYFGKSTSPIPHKCEKSKVILKEALDFLKSKQGEDGSFPDQIKNLNHSVSMSSLAGLAWLGSPDAQGEYKENIERAAKYVLENAGKTGRLGASDSGANWNQTHWAIGYGGMFIGEAHAHDPRPEYRQALQKWADTLCKQQEETGGWAHGPGGPNALNYLELEIMSNFALAAIGMAKRAELQVDEAKTQKGIQYVKACTQGGGVAYSTRKGQLGSGDPGRTAGAWWAFRLLKAKEKKLMSSMAAYWQRSLPELFEGHACPTMHVLSGALASAMHGKKTLTKYWKTFRPFMMASRVPGGAFDTRPNHESRQMKGAPTDKTWGTVFITASYALAMQAGSGRYKLIDSAK